MQICSSDALSSIFLISSLFSRRLASIACLLVSIWIFLSIIEFIHKAFRQKVDYLTRRNHAIRERAAKELAGLEARLFPEKAASRERKAAHLRADNRASPTASLKRERKEPPGKRQTGETGRRKPPGRRIRM